MGLLKKQKFPLLLGPRNRNDMRENNRNDKRNFERRDGKKRDFKGKRDYRDRDRKQEVQQADEEFTGGMVEGRNAVIEAFRSGKTVDKLFVLASSQDGPIRTIIREAKKHDTIINYVEKERLDELSTTGKHQGVIAQKLLILRDRRVQISHPEILRQQPGISRFHLKLRRLIGAEIRVFQHSRKLVERLADRELAA